MTADFLSPVLALSRVAGPHIRQAEVTAISQVVSTVPAAEFIEAATLVPGLSWDDGPARPAEYYEMHSGRWWIDTGDAGNRRHLLMVITAAVLIDALSLDYSTPWVTRVAPAVLAVRSVLRDGTCLRLDLLRSPAAPLPMYLAGSVNRDDYAEFAAAVGDAAPVLASPAGHTITFTGRGRLSQDPAHGQ